MIWKTLMLPSRRWVLWVDSGQWFCYTGILCFKVRTDKALLLESQWSETHAVLSCCCHGLEGDQVASVVCALVSHVVWYMCMEKEVGRESWENWKSVVVKNIVCHLLRKGWSFIFSISSLLEEVNIVSQKWEGLLWCIVCRLEHKIWFHDIQLQKQGVWRRNQHAAVCRLHQNVFKSASYCAVL